MTYVFSFRTVMISHYSLIVEGILLSKTLANGKRNLGLNSLLNIRECSNTLQGFTEMKWPLHTYTVDRVFSAVNNFAGKIFAQLYFRPYDHATI